VVVGVGAVSATAGVTFAAPLVGAGLLVDSSRANMRSSMSWRAAVVDLCSSISRSRVSIRSFESIAFESSIGRVGEGSRDAGGEGAVCADSWSLDPELAAENREFARKRRTLPSALRESFLL
jgi:hypothetical protein